MRGRRRVRPLTPVEVATRHDALARIEERRASMNAHPSRRGRTPVPPLDLPAAAVQRAITENA